METANHEKYSSEMLERFNATLKNLQHIHYVDKKTLLFDSVYSSKFADIFYSDKSHKRTIAYLNPIAFSVYEKISSDYVNTLLNHIAKGKKIGRSVRIEYKFYILNYFAFLLCKKYEQKLSTIYPFFKKEKIIDIKKNFEALYSKESFGCRISCNFDELSKNKKKVDVRLLCFINERLDIISKENNLTKSALLNEALLDVFYLQNRIHDEESIMIIPDIKKLSEAKNAYDFQSMMDDVTFDSNEAIKVCKLLLEKLETLNEYSKYNYDNLILQCRKSKISIAQIIKKEAIAISPDLKKQLEEMAGESKMNIEEYIKYLLKSESNRLKFDGVSDLFFPDELDGFIIDVPNI